MTTKNGSSKLVATSTSKYNNDEEFRRKAIERSKEYYHKNKVLKVNRPPKVVNSKTKPAIIKTKTGVKFAFRLKYVCERLARKPETFRKWIQEDVIPKTPYRVGISRVYTEEMIEAMFDAMKTMGFPSKVDKKTFSKLVRQKWPEGEV